MTHFFFFLNIASYKCGYILSNKTHIVTVHHATITKNSSCQLWTTSFTKLQTLVTLTWLRWSSGSSGSSAPSGNPGITGSRYGAGQEDPSSTQTLIPTLLRGAELALGTGRAGIVQRGTVSAAERQLVPALGKPLTEEVVVEASLAGGCSSLFLFPRHTSPPSLHHWAWAFFLEKPNPHCLTKQMSQAAPEALRKNQMGKAWTRACWFSWELRVFEHPPVCPAADFLVWSILHAVLSFTEYFSSLAVQMR